MAVHPAIPALGGRAGPSQVEVHFSNFTRSCLLNLKRAEEYSQVRKPSVQSRVTQREGEGRIGPKREQKSARQTSSPRAPCLHQGTRWCDVDCKGRKWPGPYGRGGCSPRGICFALAPFSPQLFSAHVPHSWHLPDSPLHLAAFPHLGTLLSELCASPPTSSFEL